VRALLKKELKDKRFILSSVDSLLVHNTEVNKCYTENEEQDVAVMLPEMNMLKELLSV
jgi:hypothetical protein